MSLPKPQALGLPEKFSSWRSNQEHAIDVTVTSKKRATVISAPTGFGKSAVYVGAAIQSGKRTCFVTNFRGLQDQLMEDFGSCGLVDIRGRANYKCDMRPDDPDYSCEEGHASRCPYMGTVACPSSLAEIQAARSMKVTTNYAKWCHSMAFGTGMGGFEQVIFDEAHAAHDALANALQVVLHHREIEEELGINFLYGSEAEHFDNWKRWASSARQACEAEFVRAGARINGGGDVKTSWVKKFNHLRNLMRRLGMLASAPSRDWIVGEIDKGYQFDPIRPGKYAERRLFFKIPRLIFVSATVRPKTLFMLGLGKESFDFHEFDSEFDPKRCPVYWIPTMRVDKNAKDLSMLWARHDQFAARRRDRKHLVHTISYARRDDILAHSRFASSMLINEKGEPPAATLDTFRESGPGTALVSPVFGTGYDFPMDQAEWQFICKVPFPDSRSPIVKARQADDPEYGPYHAMQDLVQMVGRLMRSKEDRGETVIPDDHIEWFRKRYGHLAPRNFHATFKTVTTVPPAPPKL